MSFPLWVHLLRLYSWYFPVLRGKARAVHWAFSRLPKRGFQPVEMVVPGGIRLELWPWVWADFCTYMLGSPEPYHLAYFTSRIHEQSVIFDVGAYIGVYALRAAQAAKKGYVHAFEPDPRSARRLQKAIEENRIHNLSVYSCAVGHQPDKLMMVLRDYPPMSSLISSPPSESSAVHGEKTTLVSVCTLDEHCRSERVDRVDLLKIDVEGAEMLVLQGASDMIAAFRPEIMVELHRDQSFSFGYSIEEVADYLRQQQYRLFYLHPGIRKPRLVPLARNVATNAARLIVIARPI